MKKLLAATLLIITTCYLPFASAEPLKINTFHRGIAGTTKLSNQILFLQIPPNDHFYVDTNQNGIFELSSAYSGNEMRAYLVRKIGDQYTVVAGCFSAFVPVASGEVSLKGVDCLDIKNN